MTHSGKSSTALRVRSLAELTDSDLGNSGADGASQRENLRLSQQQNLHRFPKLVQHRVEPPAETSLPQLEDLAAELEAALMGDLQNVASLWEPEDAEEPATPQRSTLPLVQAEIEADLASEMPRDLRAQHELPQQDRLAVELLLARGRRPDAPVKPAQAVEAVELEDRLAGELAQRLSIAVDELRVADGEEPTFDAEYSPRDDAIQRRNVLNRRLLGVVALLAIVGGGALATIHSVTARPDATVAVADELDGVSTAGIVKADAAQALPAPAAKQTYDRAAEDPALPESPQVRGADMLTGAAPTLAAGMLPGSAVSTEPVTPSVRAAYAGPTAAEPQPAPVSTVPVTEAAPVADDPVVAGAPEAAAAAMPDEAAPEAAAPVASPAPAAKKVAALAAGSPAPGMATITSGVRLRGNPDNGAPTVAMLKPGAQVEVVQCKGWCEVVADGKRGFVFKRFLAQVKS